jgi:LPXTG-site transpeptidase (sortase) family protein
MSHTHSTSENIVDVLLRPKTLVAVFVMWLIITAVGTGVAIAVTQRAMLSDGEVNAILSENERNAWGTSAQAAGIEEDEDVAVSAPTAFPDRLVIPALGKDLPVSNPQTTNIEALDEALKSSVVRYPTSGLLGEDGTNTLIFGHSSYLPVVRNKLYKAFNEIQDLKVGDKIEAVAEGTVYEYKVVRVYRASALDDSIALTVGKHRITLLTCNSFGEKSDRWVVEAEFVGISS